MAKVFARSKSEGAARLVLLALADVAADSGEVTAYKRSHSILASKANCAEGTVRRSIAKLVELGEVVVLDAGGGRKSASYAIVLDPEGVPDEGAPDDGGGGAVRAPTPRETRAHPAPDVPPVSPSPSDPASSSPIGEQESLVLEQQAMVATEGFPQFWETYPRRVAKAAAETAWAKAVKLATVGTIMNGARQYANEVAGREPDKIAHPATWLNGRRWEDPPGANASGRNPKRGGGGPVTHPRDGQAGRVTM